MTSKNAPALNKRDWEIVNSALALFEASADDDYVEYLPSQIAKTRSKVHALLDAEQATP